MMRTKIDTLIKFSPDEFLRTYRGKTPVIITEKISHWRARRHWCPDYFQQRFGNMTVAIARYEPEAAASFLDQTLADVHQKVRLEEFLAKLTCGDRRYALREDTILLRLRPELIEDLDHFFPFASRGTVSCDRYMALWIGPAGYVTGLHTDPGDTLLFQLYGRKHILLFAPEQTPYLYEETEAERRKKFEGASLQSRLEPASFRVLRDSVRWCHLQPFSPDLDKYPLYHQAHYIEAYIGPGDTLYIPDQWWHAVHSLEPAISVSIEPSFDGPLFAPEAGH
jgi:ribosomal protein L16 Arg81 hydroxylase